MRIVVAGADGFLGGHFIDELTRHDVDLVALVHPTTDTSHLVPLGIDLRSVDVRDGASLRPHLDGADFVVNAIHLATPGFREADYHAFNVTGTTNLLDAALDQDLRGFVQLSSTAVYGDTLPSRPVEEDWAFRPRTPLARSCATAEHAARTYRRRLPLTILRPALPFGPRDDGDFSRLLLHFLAARRPLLIGGGRAPLSLTYAPDLARALWNVLDQFEEAADQVFHVKSIDADWRSVLEETSALLHRRPRPRPLPSSLARLLEQLHGPGRWLLRPPHLVQQPLALLGRPQRVDDSSLRSSVGFAPLFGLRAALRQTLEWLSHQRDDIHL